MCNPAFADRPSWWDVLCNIETGRITVSKDLRPPLAGLHGGMKGLKLDHTDRGDEGVGMMPAGKEKDKGDKGDAADNFFMDEVSSSLKGTAIPTARVFRS